MKEHTAALEIKQKINNHENIVMSPSAIIPVTTMLCLLRDYEDLQTQIKNCNKETIQKETIQQCLQIIKNYADHVTTQEHKNLGDGTVKNIALHEVIGLLKKEFNNYSFNIC
jgi:hypothetical protein